MLPVDTKLMLPKYSPFCCLSQMVVELMDNTVGKSVLIEKFLEGEYKKFNSNMGYVEDDVKRLVEQMDNLGLGGTFNKGLSNALGAIVEGDSEEESDEEREIFDSKEAVPYAGHYSDLQDAYFPQAFSHFTYQKSTGAFMVVDLQGVFSINRDGTKLYQLTDPVIHKHSKKKNRRTRKWSFGRTDRGEKGMKAFFETHKCTDACKLLGLTEVDAEKV